MISIKQVVILALLWSCSCSSSQKRSEAYESFGDDATVPIDVGNKDSRHPIDTDIEREIDNAESGVQYNTWVPPLTSETASVWSREVGWRDSEKPFSTGLTSVYGRYNIDASSIWSDTRGVYALISYSDIESRTDNYTGLYLNDGTGWTEIYRIDLSGYLYLSGIPQGPQILYGSGLSCGIEFLQNGERECQVGFAEVNGIFVVDQDLIYAVQGRDVIRYREGKWRLLAELPKAETVESDFDSIVFSRAIWGNEQVVAVVGEVDQEGVVFTVNPQTGIAERRVDAPNGKYWKVWGFNQNDIWASTIGGLFQSNGQLIHFNGENWETVWTDDDGGGGIRGMWGDKGVLYFYTRNTFGYWNGEQIRVVAHMARGEDVEFAGLWGNSESEIFLSILKGKSDNPKIGELLIARYDGSNLRLF